MDGLASAARRKQRSRSPSPPSAFRPGLDRARKAPSSGNPERARKAEKNERDEGGEVGVDGCNRGRTGAVIGDDEVDVGGDVDIRGIDLDEAASFVASGFATPAFFRSSSSRFVCSSSCVCKLCRMASCNIILSASSLVILIIPSTRLPTLLCSPVPAVP